MFWEDLCSDKEERYLKSKWEKAGAPLIQQLELEEYLRDKNSLLANFGRLGREMVKQLEESGLQVIEDYDLPLPLKNEPRYTPFIDSDIAFRESNQKETMLECLQADLLLLRNPEKITEKKKEFSSDSSIQLHQAPTRYREVEILYNTLMGLIERHSEETKAIQPKDILVMAPNIAEYAPYINAVFGKAESQLPYKLLDQPIQSQSRLVQGFLHLLTLNFGLWELDSILQLFDQSSFQKKHGLTKEEISKIRQWASQMNVRWGKDLLHREEILAGRGFPETNHSSLNGTWEEGISRLLCGYSMIPGEYLNSLQPLPGVDLTDADLIGKWIELIRSLKEDTKIINEETGLTLEEWGKALKKLLETYFTFESTEQIEKQGYEILEAFCRLLQSRSKKFENQRFYFPTIQSQMESFLSQQSIEGEKQLQSVHFSTLFPMRAIPSKVIALIGMEEDSFPRKNRLDPFLSLNQMCGNKEIDYTPSQTDYDRYLFLENILSARNYLILSYPESGSKGEKNASPSLLITELFEYLDKGYTVQGEKISKSCHWKHPFYSFDKSYFAGGSAFPKSYFPSQYRAAIAFYGKEKSGPHRFISDYLYSHIREKAPLKAEIIDLRRLTATAQNPFKSYLNQGLGIYLNRNLNGEEKIKERGEFALSSLDNFLLRKEVLYAPSEAVIKKAEKEGRLPIGLFGALAKDDLEKEKKELKNHFINLEIDPEEFFQIEFNAQLKAPVQHRKGVWNLPAIELTFENQPIKIVGKIEDVTPKGLLIHGKDQLEDVAKAWPQILLLNAAILKFPAMGLTANRLHFTKSLKSRESFADPYPDLINYIDYYRYSLTNLSYLHPEWIEDLLTSEPEHFEKKISSKLMNSYATAYNPYLHWIFNYDDYPKERAVIEIWKQKAELLFGNVYRTWFK
jgi:exodeoxyribonuclease V gamma subunit